jgi:galactonate dehydratase
MKRRLVLQSLPFAPLALRPVAAAPPEIAKITITDLEIFSVKVNRRGNWVLPRLRTSSGITGIGDASHGKDEQVVLLMRRFFERLKGRGIFDIEWLRREVQPEIKQGGVSAAVALSGLEQCLWDIRGKAFGLPVYELLGGRLHERIHNYANINRSTDPRTPAGFAAMAERAVGAGFSAVKLAPFDEMPRGLTDAARIEEFTKTGLECATAVRHAIGSERDLLIDVHSHYDLQRGLDLARRFEPLHLFWIEEVTPPKPLEWLATINREAKMPTAGGESIYGVGGFYPYIAGGAVDVIMPDVKYCGGVLELKKIAAMAEGAGLLVAPHGPASPVGNMVGAHVCATMPNFHILEFSYGEVPWRAELIEPAENVLPGGYLSFNGRPGYGIELNEKTIAAHKV